jgi:hypothetical protein
MEPLVMEGAEKRRPLFAPFHRGGGRRIHISVAEFGEDLGAAASRLGTNIYASVAAMKLGAAVTASRTAAALPAAAKADEHAKDDGPEPVEVELVYAPSVSPATLAVDLLSVCLSLSPSISVSVCLSVCLHFVRVNAWLGSSSHLAAACDAD